MCASIRRSFLWDEWQPLSPQHAAGTFPGPLSGLTAFLAPRLGALQEAQAPTSHPDLSTGWSLY